jgi:hypothetical protein
MKPRHKSNRAASKPTSHPKHPPFGNKFLNDGGLVLGEYYLGKTKKGTVWIEHSQGEGMETDIKSLEKLIFEFWKKEF